MKGQRNGRCGPTRPMAAVMTLALLLGGVFTAASPCAADEYNPQEAGHPLKLLAYLAFPLGTLLDYGLMRPAYWVVQKEPFRTIFGYEYMAHDDEEVHEDMTDAMRAH